MIYLDAAVSKLNVPEWVDGTAMYYWVLSSFTGAPSYLRPLLTPFVESDLVALLTWAVIISELLLAGALFLPNSRWKPVLLLGSALHISIIFVLGIASFSIAMFGALILYLHPFEKEFRLPLRPTNWLQTSKGGPLSSRLARNLLNCHTNDVE